MRVWWLLLAAPALAADASLRGVHPSVAARYRRPASGLFECLDGSKQIPFEQVNDDYCDCPDGSDEPGTSACNNGSFYCANRGHIPGVLPAIQVNDGVCDYDVCCDGSDEWDSPARCEDRCAEMGRAYRRLAETERTAHAQGARRLAELVDQARHVRTTKTAELAALRARVDELESARLAAEQHKDELEKKQQQHAAQTKQEHESALDKLSEQYLPDLVAYRKTLAAELHRLRAQRDTLVRMLRSVRAGHNTEFNDPAVATAVERYAEFAEAYPYMEDAAEAYADEDDARRSEREAEMDRDSAEQDDRSLEACRSAVDVAESERETAESDVGLLLGLLRDLRAGYNKNYHDLAVKAAVEALRSFEDSRDKDAAAAAAARASVDYAELAIRVAEAKAQLDRLAVPASADDGAEASLDAVDGDGNGGSDSELDKLVADARSAFWDLQMQKNTAESKVAETNELLETADLGPHDMYLPVKGDCVELDAGEYKYRVCLLDRVSQEGNHDGQRQSLGTFAGFGADHTVHRYTQGTKCWNGPERSLTATFVCDKDIKVLSVSEPEKCEYHAKMTGPFACQLPSEPAADQPPAPADPTPASLATAGDQHHPHDEL